MSRYIEYTASHLDRLIQSKIDRDIQKRMQDLTKKKAESSSTVKITEEESAIDSRTTVIAEGENTIIHKLNLSQNEF